MKTAKAIVAMAAAWCAAACAFGSVVRTPLWKAFWQVPAWMPGEVEGEDTPGSSNYDHRRIDAAAAAAHYAAFDAADCRRAYMSKMTNNQNFVKTHTVETRRISDPLWDKVDGAYAHTSISDSPYIPFVRGLCLGTWESWPSSSSAFDYNYHGYPTFCQYYRGKLREFGWTEQPLGHKVYETSLPRLDGLSNRNKSCNGTHVEPGGTVVHDYYLPYREAVFAHVDRHDLAQHLVSIVFDAICYEEHIEGGNAESTVPAYLDDIQTNWEDHVTNDLSYDEMIAVKFASDPRDIFSNTYRRVTQQMSAYDRAVAMVDRTYVPYDYETNSVTCTNAVLTQYHKRYTSVIDAEDYGFYFEIDPATHWFDEKTTWPKDGDSIGFYEADTYGEETTVTNIAVDIATPRLRVSRAVERGGVIGSTGPVGFLGAGDAFDRTLDDWFGDADEGYVDIICSGGRIAAAGGSCDVEFKIWKHGATDTTNATVTFGMASVELTNGCGTVRGTAQRNYSTGATVTRSHTPVFKYPTMPGADRFVKKKTARMFDSFLVRRDTCPAVTDVLDPLPREVREGEDWTWWGYRLKDWGYTTTNSLASAMASDNAQLEEKMRAELEAAEGSGEYDDPEKYAPFEEGDALYVMNDVRSWDWAVVASQYSSTSNRVWRNAAGDWERSIGTQLSVTLSGHAEATNVVHEKFAADTKRSTVGQVDWSFPVQMREDGYDGIAVDGGTRFCSAHIGEGEYKDAYAGLGGICYADGDDPVIYVCKSGFEGAFSNAADMAWTRFNYMTNAEEAAFRNAFAGDTGLTNAAMGTVLFRTGNEAFSGAFAGTGLGGEVRFDALAIGGTGAFENAWSGAGAFSNVSFRSLRDVPPRFIRGAFGPLSATGPELCLDEVDFRSATNVDVGGLEIGIVTNRFTARFDRLEAFWNATGYALWPQSMRNALDIRLDEAETPLGGEGLFWRGTPEKLAWDSTVTVPTNALAAWRSSEWTNFCDNIYGAGEAWMLTAYPTNATGGALTFKCRCQESGISTNRIGVEGGAYVRTGASALGDSRWELGYTNVWSRDRIRAYYDGSAGRVYGPWFTVPLGELVIDEAWDELDYVEARLVQRNAMIYGRYGNVPIQDATLYYLYTNETTQTVQEQEIDIINTTTDDGGGFIIQGDFDGRPTTTIGFRLKCHNDVDMINGCGDMNVLTLTDVRFIYQGIYPSSRGYYILYDVTGSGTIVHRGGECRFSPDGFVMRACNPNDQTKYDTIMQWPDAIVYDGTNFSWEVRNVKHEGTTFDYNLFMLQNEFETDAVRKTDLTPLHAIETRYKSVEMEGL